MRDLGQTVGLGCEVHGKCLVLNVEVKGVCMSVVGCDDGSTEQPGSGRSL